MTEGNQAPDPGSADDQAWASIVANFGQRAQLDDDGVPQDLIASAPPEPMQVPVAVESEDHYLPPTPPPVGLADGPRGAAWLGLLGAPTLFVIALLAGISIPRWLSLVAVVAFVASLVYLVATMGGTEHDEPWDDGARV